MREKSDQLRNTKQSDEKVDEEIKRLKKKLWEIDPSKSK